MLYGYVWHYVANRGTMEWLENANNGQDEERPKTLKE